MKKLFIFEMANNHQGSIEHGKKIIQEIRKVCDNYPMFDFAFKFQYRDLDTFIHKDFRERFDIKNVKRFKDTRLSMEQFALLLDEVRKNNFLAICTPFDEKSVDYIYEQKYDYIKIASCSFNDWPLLEKIASKNMPVIASGAGSSLEQLKNVVTFFNNRNIDFSLMHCVAEYPTPNCDLQLNQIDYYKTMFPNIRIGFSTHENPDDMVPVMIAMAKNADIFEKHVGVETNEISLNAYSANPQQVDAWLKAALVAYEACGVYNERYVPKAKEIDDLNALRRGVFLKDGMIKGKITLDDVYLAFPCIPGQLVANELSKYNTIVFKESARVEKDGPIMLDDIVITNTTEVMYDIIRELTSILKESNVVVPIGSTCEISHHYGIERFKQVGVAMIDCINREYCKKILVVLPGQEHPNHFHKKKEESFVILHGDLKMVIDGVEHNLHKGDIMTVERNANHSFSSVNGCVFEEISTTHYINDSYYDLEKEFASPRKSKVHFFEGFVE